MFSIPFIARSSRSSLRYRLHASLRALSSTPRRLNEFPQLTSLDVYSEEEEMIRDTVRRFATEVIKPKVREMDENEMMDPAIIKGLFEHGLMGVETPSALSGTEASFTSAILVVEELAKVDASVSVLCDVHNTLVNTVLRTYATQTQQEKWLPQLATADLGSFCLSEESSGSDAFALKTKATKSNGVWRIDGTKMWITNSYEASIFLVFANVNPSAGYKGITCFIVPRSTPGVSIAKKEQKLGIRASSTCVVDFDGVEVPEENIIGGEGKGYKIAIEILNEGRIGIAAQMLGIAQGALSLALPYTYTRKQFGQTIGTFQGMQHQFADAALQIECSRLLTYNAARLKESGLPFTKQAAMAKLHASRTAESVSSKAIEWMGGLGFTRETGVEKYWRDAKIGAIYEGTSNIQLQTIAKFLEKEFKA